MSQAVNINHAKNIGRKIVKEIEFSNYINSVRWNNTESYIAVLSNFGGSISILNANNLQITSHFNWISGAYSFNSMEFLPDESIITSALPGVDSAQNSQSAQSGMDSGHRDSGFFSLIQWQLTNGKILKYFPNPKINNNIQIDHPINSDIFSISHDYSILAAITNRASDGIFLYDTNNGALINIIKIPQSPLRQRATSVSFSPNSKNIAIGTSQGAVYVVNARSGELISSFIAYPGGNFRCSAISFSPDGSLIATGRGRNININFDNQYSAEIWRLSDGELFQHLEGIVHKNQTIEETSSVYSMSWSQKDNLLAIGDGVSLRVWKINQSGAVLDYNQTFSNAVYSVSFSHEGKLAAASGSYLYIFQ